VKIEALTPRQRDILLTLGLKTIPKYNYFELLAFAAKLANQSFAEVLQTNELEADYQEYLNSLANQEITINQTI